MLQPSSLAAVVQYRHGAFSDPYEALYFFDHPNQLIWTLGAGVIRRWKQVEET